MKKIFGMRVIVFAAMCFAAAPSQQCFGMMDPFTWAEDHPNKEIEKKIKKQNDKLQCDVNVPAKKSNINAIKKVSSFIAKNSKAGLNFTFFGILTFLTLIKGVDSNCFFPQILCKDVPPSAYHPLLPDGGCMMTNSYWSTENPQQCLHLSTFPVVFKKWLCWAIREQWRFDRYSGLTWPVCYWPPGFGNHRRHGSVEFDHIKNETSFDTFRDMLKECINLDWSKYNIEIKDNTVIIQDSVISHNKLKTIVVTTLAVIGGGIVVIGVVGTSILALRACIKKLKKRFNERLERYRYDEEQFDNDTAVVEELREFETDSE